MFSGLRPIANSQIRTCSFPASQDAGAEPLANQPQRTGLVDALRSLDARRCLGSRLGNQPASFRMAAKPCLHGKTNLRKFGRKYGRIDSAVRATYHLVY